MSGSFSVKDDWTKVKRMKEATYSAIRNALIATLDKFDQLEKRGALPQEGEWEYHRDARGQWSGRLVPKLSLLSLSSSLYVDKEIADIAAIEKALQKDYPEYLKLVGTPTEMTILQPSGILASLVHEVHERFGTFSLKSEQIDSILRDASNFFERKMIRLRLYAPALNLHGPADTPPIELVKGVTLRPITDDEFTRFYGGNPIFQMRSMPFIFPDFVFVKEVEIKKVFGEHPPVQEDLVHKPFQDELDRCMLILATFKDAGAVGHDGIWTTPAELTLGAVFGGQRMFLNEHVPPGRYEIAPEEASKLETYGKAFKEIHSTLEMASQRLVDSSRRAKPRDAIVDAVIGLEGILLSNIENRAELRFRFALHYALLLPAEIRRDAFNTARDLYDIRSNIAHGNPSKKEVKINGKTVPMGEAATLARSTLRKTINFFIANAANPEFMTKDYWVSKALSL